MTETFCSKTAREEIDLFLAFINEWMEANPYNPARLEQHNEKYIKEATIFFKESNFKTLKREDFF